MLLRRLARLWAPAAPRDDSLKIISHRVAARLSGLPPGERKRIQRVLARLARLPSDQRERVLQALARFSGLPPDQRVRLFQMVADVDLELADGLARLAADGLAELAAELAVIERGAPTGGGATEEAPPADRRE